MDTDVSTDTDISTGANEARSDLAARFAHAWADLGERLSRGVETLSSATTSDDERLRSKRDALSGALAVWTSLTTLEAARAWRSFTDDVFALWLVNRDAHRCAAGPAERDSSGGRCEGFALALEYQRGYGADVDAPPLVMNHILRETRPPGGTTTSPVR